MFVSLLEQVLVHFRRQRLPVVHELQIFLSGMLPVHFETIKVHQSWQDLLLSVHRILRLVLKGVVLLNFHSQLQALKEL